MPTVSITTDGYGLLHLPPAVASVKVSVCDTQTLVIPFIGDGSGLTVIDFTAKHPVASAKVMVVVPAAIPLTIPVLTVADAVLLLLQVPPVVVSDNTVVKPAQTSVFPVIPDGDGLVFTVVVVLHPVGKV